MKTSTDRILTTHVGSLPRSEAVTRGVFAIDNDEEIDLDEHCREISAAVAEVVARQVAIGIDVVSDGEMSKLSYATYIKHRVSGFEGDSPRRAPSDLEEHPSYLERQAKTGGTPTYKRPMCVGPVEVMDPEPCRQDTSNLRAAAATSEPLEAFMNAASPGVIALFQPDDYYRDHEKYLYALAEAMRAEYEAIVAAGFVLQLDSPDLGLGRHMMFKGRPDSEYERLAGIHVEALNHAVRNIPADRMRLHICWGNYEGPHTHDAPMSQVLPIALKAKPQALLFEAANPRHAHEWTVFAEAELPDDKVLVPGVIDTTTHFVEHPELIAQRIERFAGIVGRERVMAGTDCGFSTFAGYAGVDPEIAYAKLASLVEGAALASQRLW
ncbi:MAG: cobalamin-independent methionine synthase II family protein [Acidimicrobiaceae bacterium]|nr:cobalamin-independent methionine synthase II family protein [Acidimicrobiaceae bacterium]MXW74943.1 cobalamin-independent methionine synthase II family protein [Acidimicrobiaceae bacterium]MYA73698.1 cobalamin-independent methionine synthase II family protein [Acidimicrobiaceae bacterium]MYD06618.1 cobalamin-independent methionine synthase II family protein [Acidimicrobiaceae bacterium]MYG55824.1 cobalamin-independent methionine synthase II family protein [Acidimicrobiaceae bacterium]